MSEKSSTRYSLDDVISAVYVVARRSGKFKDSYWGEHERAKDFCDLVEKELVSEGNRKLSHLASLPPNWNSYGAPPISSNALALAGTLYDVLQPVLPGLAIVPTTSGGVSLEWTGDGMSVEAEITADDATDPHVEAARVEETDEQIDRLETMR